MTTHAWIEMVSVNLVFWTLYVGYYMGRLHAACVLTTLWLEKSELALEKSNEIKDSIATCEREIAQLNGRLTAIISTMEDLQVKSEEFDQKKAEKIKHLSIELNKIIADIVEFKTEITVFDLALKELGTKIRCAEDAVKEQDQHIKDLEFELAEADKELSVTNHKITVIKN